MSYPWCAKSPGRPRNVDRYKDERMLVEVIAREIMADGSQNLATAKVKAWMWLDAFKSIIMGHLVKWRDVGGIAAGGGVQITNFGTFATRSRAARAASICVPNRQMPGQWVSRGIAWHAVTVPKFVAAHAFRARVDPKNAKKRGRKRMAELEAERGARQVNYLGDGGPGQASNVG